jgi:hypothetical protein
LISLYRRSKTDSFFKKDASLRTAAEQEVEGGEVGQVVSPELRIWGRVEAQETDLDSLPPEEGTLHRLFRAAGQDDFIGFQFGGDGDEKGSLFPEGELR